MSKKLWIIAGVAVAVIAVVKLRKRAQVAYAVKANSKAAANANNLPGQDVPLSIDVDLGEPVLMGHFGRVRGNTGVVPPLLQDRAP